MKDVLRKQAKESVARSVKQLVTTDLIQQLGLSTEQTAELKKLLNHRGAIGFDFMMPVMTGELDEAGLAELGRKTRMDMATIAGELKTFLGEDGHKTFETYENSQPDRDRVEKLGTRLKEVGAELSLEQRGQLLAAMSEERSNFRFAIDYNDTSQIDYEHFHDFYSEDKLSNYFDEMNRLNERMLQRAQAILPADQVAEFQQVLKVQLQKSKYVVKTTNAMLGKGVGK
jgi:CheY-like chemotaxis protein